MRNFSSDVLEFNGIALHFLITFFTIVTKSITGSGVDCCHQNDQKGPQSDLRKFKRLK
jgi:hypothetical protein